MYRMKKKTIQITKGVKKRHQTVKRYRNYTKVYMSTGKKTTIGNFILGVRNMNWTQLLLILMYEQMHLLLRKICLYNWIKTLYNCWTSKLFNGFFIYQYF